MTETDTNIGTEIVKAIRKFQKELGKTGNVDDGVSGLQHINTEAFGRIVHDYASALIDQQMRSCPEQVDRGQLITENTYEISEQDLMGLEKIYVDADGFKYQYAFASRSHCS